MAETRITGPVNDPGRRTPLARQVAFLAFNSVADANVTGNGTQATIDFDTEVFDHGANFAADTFTAPVTGRYLIQTAVQVSGITGAGDDIRMAIVTSNREVRGQRFGKTDDLPTTIAMAASITTDMDANDTVTVYFQVDGEASDVVDVDGNASILVTFFSGFLLA